MSTDTEKSITKEQTIFNHSGNSIKTSDREISYTILSEEPLVLVLENVLSDEECEGLIHLSKDRLERSKIGKSHEVNDIRTSKGTFLEEAENELVVKIENRLSSIMNIPVEHAEPLQILNYAPGDEYKPHFDYFTSKTKSISNNRISTLVMYLNEVKKGGETTFPKLNLSVPPKKGTAVYFEYFYNDHHLNELTWHAGNSVISGEKWAATLWMRKQRRR